MAELRAAGVELPGCTLRVDERPPAGGGPLLLGRPLRRARARALRGRRGRRRPQPVELARLCSRIENEYAGAETGLLDQLASLLGQEGRALRLDMRTLEAEPVQLELGGHVLAVLDSGARAASPRSGYNERREECRRAAELLGVESLRDAATAPGLPGPARPARPPRGERERARRRRRRGAEGARRPARSASSSTPRTRSLRDDYEVSVPEVERAVAACREAGALGARIMGGGFGGSVLALFPPDDGSPGGRHSPVSPGPGARLLC